MHPTSFKRKIFQLWPKLGVSQLCLYLKDRTVYERHMAGLHKQLISAAEQEDRVVILLAEPVDATEACSLGYPKLLPAS